MGHGISQSRKKKKVVKGIDGVIKYCEEFEAKRDDLLMKLMGWSLK